MTKVKVTNTNILLMVVVIVLTVVPQLAIVILYEYFHIDIGEYLKEGDTAKAILLAVNQYGFIFLPVMIFTLINRLNVKEVFRLNLINIPTLILTIIMALAAWFISQFVTIIIYHIYSSIIGQPSNEMADVIPENIALGMFLIALFPAICEEALFRGITLKAYENRGTVRAIIISAALFSIIHLSVIRFAGPLIIGILAGYLVVKSNSILPGIITHFVFNGISMTIFYAVDKFPEEVERFPTIPEYLVLSFVTLFFLGVLAVCIIAFNYVNLSKKNVKYDNPVVEFLYLVLWGAPKEPGRFRKPIGTIRQDIISILSYAPIIVILVIVVLINILEVLEILLR